MCSHYTLAWQPDDVKSLCKQASGTYPVSRVSETKWHKHRRHIHCHALLKLALFSRLACTDFFWELLPEMWIIGSDRASSHRSVLDPSNYSPSLCTTRSGWWQKGRQTQLHSTTYLPTEQHAQLQSNPSSQFMYSFSFKFQLVQFGFCQQPAW